MKTRLTILFTIQALLCASSFSINKWPRAYALQEYGYTEQEAYAKVERRADWLIDQCETLCTIEGGVNAVTTNVINVNCHTESELAECWGKLTVDCKL